MAEIRGELRNDATYGEKLTLKLLKQNLPKDFTVYVETPIHKKREIRYPDFIVLTNYGVIVLEVKDWVSIEGADKHHIRVRTRQNEVRSERNPVTVARELAIDLSNELNTKRNNGESGETPPWSYAAVLINLTPTMISRLQPVCGEDYLFGKADLENSDILLNRLKKTFPVKHMRSLTRHELELIRRTIYPVVEIEMEDRPAFVLDIQQERIVAEPTQSNVPDETTKAPEKEPASQQDLLFVPAEIEKVDAEEEELPDSGKRISRNVAVRLVRGFSGSGKTLVLIQRAKYLEALNPDWNIAILTYNKPLQEQMNSFFIGSRARPITFHSLCRQIYPFSDNKNADLDKWMDEFKIKYPIFFTLGRETIRREINWLREMGVTDCEAYINLERHGIGKNNRLSSDQRKKIFTILSDYRSWLRDFSRWDWPEIPLTLLEKLETNQVQPQKFDAILIDEAQDWAPVWFKVIKHFLEPAHGMLFLADDPSQSIFRYFSWKEKSVDVVGRTRWLRVPYRNTFEIYNAAYSLISGYEEIQKSLAETGELIKPDISSIEMRHGPRPLIRRFASQTDEINSLNSIVDSLKTDGYRDNQIAILVRNSADRAPLENIFKRRGVLVHPIHSFKGLEREAIIIPHLHKTFTKPDEETMERRLMYMAMTRARLHLYMTYSGRLPKYYAQLREQGLADFIE
jgi:hypothetical protein